jgi:hypothetical protein
LEKGHLFPDGEYPQDLASSFYRGNEGNVALWRSNKRVHAAFNVVFSAYRYAWLHNPASPLFGQPKKQLQPLISSLVARGLRLKTDVEVSLIETHAALMNASITLERKVLEYYQ